MDRHERDRTIVELRGRGVTLSAIGARFGLSATRVRQIVAENGGPDAGLAATARVRALADRAERTREKVLSAAEKYPAATVEELVELSGASHDEVTATLPARERKRRKDSVGGGVTTTVYVRALSQVAAEHGLDAITYRQYDALRRSHHPSSARIRQVLGSWARACKAAGVETGSDGRGGGVPARWDADGVLEWVCRYLGSHRPDYSYRDFDSWLRGQDGAPSAQTVRNRTGMSWTQLLAEGNRRVHGEVAR